MPILDDLNGLEPGLCSKCNKKKMYRKSKHRLGIVCINCGYEPTFKELSKIRNLK
jgi:DNA-directed RNA polymerase subunit RPC12/RpoP